MITDKQKHIFEKARLSRDARFDGTFFIAVKTTKIYCRPICPVRLPKPENIEFYLNAYQAAEAGFRPCLRCRPESAPNSPAWNGTSTSVSRALKLIAMGYLNDHNISDLADKLGMTERHLSRLFRDKLSLSMSALAQYYRLKNAKRLIDTSQLSMEDIASAAGYKSVRRFNSHVKSVYQRSPKELRKVTKTSGENGNHKHYLQFELAYRPPYDWQRMIGFLAKRAAPGVEVVKTDSHGKLSYHRLISIEEECGLIEVEHHDEKPLVICRIYDVSSRHIFTCIERIKNVLDLNADLAPIYRTLKKDKVMATLIKQHKGLRLPGCWHPFEIIVRAIIGQQISVAGATTVLGRIISAYGQPITKQQSHDKYSLSKDVIDYALSLGLTHHYPKPELLAQLDEASLSMPKSRAAAIKLMAQAVMDDSLDLSTEHQELLYSQLLAIKGIGPWTAQYVMMRAFNNPDTLLSGDLVLQKHAARIYQSDEPRLTEKQLQSLAEQWRPWRAYGAMIIWNS